MKQVSVKGVFGVIITLIKIHAFIIIIISKLKKKEFIK